MQDALAFHPLTFITERNGVMVGRADTESYAMLSADGAGLLRHLADGMSVADATRWYESTFGEPVDMTDFLAALAGLGFIKRAGEISAEPRRVRYQALGRALFSRAAAICYLAIAAAALAVMIRHPLLRPHPQVLFFSSSLILMQVVLTVAQTPLMCWHEFFHVMAGRRIGLPTRLGAGRRLYFFVFETHLNGLLKVPPRQRYLPFMAGIIADGLAFCGLTLLAAIYSPSGSAWPSRLALALAFTVLLRVAWQVLIFLRTDLYYVLTTWLGYADLAGATSAYIRGRLARLPRLAWIARWRGAARWAGQGEAWDDDKTWSARERTAARRFAALSIAGGSVLLILAVFAIIPALTTFAARLVSGLAHGTLGGPQFWDAAVTAGLLLIQVILLPLLAGGKRRRSSSSSSREEVTT